jgi:hypothetical protein
MHPRKRLSIKSATVAGMLLASCWGLQVSLSIQRQPRRSCTANTSVIPPIASQGLASCLGLVRWHALRSVITPVAI